MFGYYEDNNEKFVIKKELKRVIVDSFVEHCSDIWLDPADVDEDKFKSYLYDLVTYSDDIFEEIIKEVEKRYNTLPV